MSTFPYFSHSALLGSNFGCCRASSGLGKEFAKMLYWHGFNLVLVARRGNELDQLRNEIYEQSRQRSLKEAQKSKSDSYSKEDQVGLQDNRNRSQASSNSGNMKEENPLWSRIPSPWHSRSRQCSSSRASEFVTAANFCASSTVLSLASPSGASLPVPVPSSASNAYTPYRDIVIIPCDLARANGPSIVVKKMEALGILEKVCIFILYPLLLLVLVLHLPRHPYSPFPLLLLSYL